MSEGLDGRRAATASYMEEMLGELATIGRNINCDFLVFLLEMAQHEAKTIANEGPTPGRPNHNKRMPGRQAKGLTAEELAALFAKKPPGRH